MSWIKCVVKTYLYQEKGVSLVQYTKVGCKLGEKGRHTKLNQKRFLVFLEFTSVGKRAKIYADMQSNAKIVHIQYFCQSLPNITHKQNTVDQFRLKTYNLSAFWNILGTSLLFFRTDVDISRFLKNICINIEHQHIKAATYKSIAQYNLKGNKLVTRILNIALNVCGTLQC